MTSAELKTLIESYAYIFSNEIQLQDGIKKTFDMNSVQYEREKTFGNNRIDFVHSTIAIEIKIKQPAMKVLKQLHRYAQIDTITEIMLITSRSMHKMPPTLNDKTLTVIRLNTSL